MEIVVIGLSVITGIVNLVCFIMTLIRLFSKEGVGLGILGLICGIYTFYWGWKNIHSPSDRTVMIVWSAGLVASIVFNILARSA